jgi:hypothetical protein
MDLVELGRVRFDHDESTAIQRHVVIGIATRIGREGRFEKHPGSSRTKSRLDLKRDDHHAIAISIETVFVLGELIRQDLDRHIPAELSVSSPIHLAHPTLADRLEDLVMGEFVTRLE